MTRQRLFVGLDVGSKTVKAIVVDPQDDQILWQDYQRHDTKQPEKTLEFLQRIEKEFQLPADHFRIFVTGSGGGGITPLIGAKFVQEVNAVSLAVEKMHPEVGSVIELGRLTETPTPHCDAVHACCSMLARTLAQAGGRLVVQPR